LVHCDKLACNSIFQANVKRLPLLLCHLGIIIHNQKLSGKFIIPESTGEPTQRVGGAKTNGYLVSLRVARSVVTNRPLLTV
jgi:hypothetical protein